ncbi:MAG: Rne/Rng family ribonuclease [Propionibacteriaceae bacterium]|nr:Rne/Rng family ribonuclease [Propionibacteriaceae bacterium]
MLDHEPDTNSESIPTQQDPAKEPAPPRRRRAAVRAAGPPAGADGAPVIETVGTTPEPSDEERVAEAPVRKSSARKSTRSPAKKAASDADIETPEESEPPRRPRKRAAKKVDAAAPAISEEPAPQSPEAGDDLASVPADLEQDIPEALLTTEAEPVPPLESLPEAEQDTEAALADQEQAEPLEDDAEALEDREEPSRRRRRRRGGRRRRRGAEEPGAEVIKPAENLELPLPEEVERSRESLEMSPGEPDDEGAAASEEPSERDAQRRRRRRRRRRGEDTSGSPDDPTEVVDRVREPRPERSGREVTGIEGSTRMEAKRQRRREGRDVGRRRAPILSEAEFLARRESVVRNMIIRQRDDLSQIAVLEDDLLVEHYVDRDSATSLIGNIYLGRVQNVLPSMEAAFIDIGRGRNAVLYAGEVDWDAFGAEGQNRQVEKVLKSGQTILVQASKDPVGAKGARLTNHVSIPGRYLVYSPGGHLSGISRKLPDNERKRLRDILADLVGESASVIVRTAAEGASEEELVRDVNRLKAQWEDIEKKVAAGTAPQLLYGEPDLTVRIVRDLFTEDFSELIIQGNGGMNDAYDSVDAYVSHVAPHLKDRLRRWDPEADGDLFGAYRLDEQIAKGLEPKVFLPSGGSLIIDRTEAMTVIDVNTGKFTGTGGNLEATVTSNNLEAAEEIVRQLRLRDIGGIIVIDFIDMVLPTNRELLLRRLVECLGRDRTRHQVAEITSLGLVQMTRKRIGTGLLEAFSTECPHCHGRGVELHDMPVGTQRQADGGARAPRSRDSRPRTGRSGRDADVAQSDQPESVAAG